MRQDGAYPQFADKYYIRNHEYVLSCLEKMTADRFKRVIKIERMCGGQAVFYTRSAFCTASGPFMKSSYG